MRLFSLKEIYSPTKAVNEMGEGVKAGLVFWKI